MSYLDQFLKVANNPYASKISDGVQSGDVDTFIDTGSYILNALISGSIYGGFPNNKITAIAGESATGKTFFVLGCVRQFLSDNPSGGVIYFESEAGITKNMIEQRGIDSTRMILFPVATVQEFRTQAIKILEKHLETPEQERPPLMMCLDSLGMLSTSKEMEDSAAGSETRDMTRAQLIRAAFRVLTLMLGKARVPMLVTNHTYQEMGLFPTKKMGGGEGLRFAADVILFLSKKKEKDGSEVIGNIIHCTNYKNRFAKENKLVDVLLSYETGLDRYYGLLEFAEKHQIIKKVSNRFEMLNGDKLYAKQILKEPAKYFTTEFLDSLEKAAQTEFQYGQISNDEDHND